METLSTTTRIPATCLCGRHGVGEAILLLFSETFLASMYLYDGDVMEIYYKMVEQLNPQ